jgi:hypothetical protein
MTILFAGGEDSELASTGSTLVSTTSTYRRTAYSRCALVAGGNGSNVPAGNYWQTPSFTAVSTLWFAAQIYHETHPSSGAAFNVLEIGKSGTPYVRLQYVVSGQLYRWQTLISGTWTNVGSRYGAIGMTL